MKRRLSLMIASVFYIGFIPGAPGTYASIAASLAFVSVYFLTHRIIPALHLSSVCLITLVGVLAAAETSRSAGIEDPTFVVIDEVAGQLVTLLFLPINSFNLILGTLVFRIFDVIKPFYIRRLEPLGKGVGIMADDLLAGVYANLVLQLANWLLRR